jgi:hypothetical protein
MTPSADAKFTQNVKMSGSCSRPNWRCFTAAMGEFERGRVRVSDVVTRQPWDDALPVFVD